MDKEIEILTEMLSNLSLAPSPRENLPTPLIEIKFVDELTWKEFKFITKKKGAYGPTKEDCKNYYKKFETDVLITVSAAHGRYSWIDRCLSPIEVFKDGFQTLTIPVTSKYKIEIVAPGTGKQLFCRLLIPGVRIIAKFELKRGQKITAALGQQPRFGIDGEGGSGGSFLVLETDKEQKLLLAAGGAGTKNGIYHRCSSKNGVYLRCLRFAKGLLKSDISGAGYTIAPDDSKFSKVEGTNPKNFENGLIGGIGNVHRRWVLNSNFKWEQRWGTDDGGFGGGSAFYENERNENCYGAGGGFTGGIDGGGGGSFSADPRAKFDHHYVEYGYCKIERIDE